MLSHKRALLFLLCFSLFVAACGDESSTNADAIDLLGDADAQTDMPADTPADMPVDTQPDVPADVPTDTPADTPADMPADMPTDMPTDMPNLCGNMMVDPGETCDGDCPVVCSDGNACTTDTPTGDASTCDAACLFELVTMCVGGDGCRPSNCDSSTDSDCSVSCGNGVTESGETCDGNCPTDCDDNIACTADLMTGSQANCNVACSNSPITMCTSGDGCCPAGCNQNSDTDCSATCGNSQVEMGETCDGNCPIATDCNDGNACTADALNGSASTCSAECSNSVITQCADADGCCPSGCDPMSDNDCQGNGPVGGACQSGGDCLLGACIDEASYGWQGGYCSAGCLVDADCGSNAHCSANANFCLDTCTSDMDCRQPDYVCADVFDGDARRECIPTATGPGVVGDACDFFSDCGGGVDGLCISQFNDGYCSEQCNTGNPCPSGSHCGLIDPMTNNGVCLDSCTMSNECRADGYLCHDIDGDAASECGPAGTGMGIPGAACDNTADCGGGTDGFCNTNANGLWNDGYCMETCATDMDCPGSSHCALIDPMTSQGVCLANCAGNANCRADGYQCYNVDGTGVNECAPAGTGTGQPGAACEGIWDCVGSQFAVCISEANNGFPGGYCSIGCAGGQGTCPGGSSCSAGAGNLCLANCTTAAQCRQAEGYACLMDTPSNHCWVAP